MNDHERIEELLAAAALAGLDPAAERELDRALADHGPVCHECTRLASDYGETAARLASALEPVPLRPGTVDEILERASGDGGPTTVTPVRGWQRLVAVAAAIVLFAGGWLIGSLMSAGPDTDGLVRSLAEGATVVRFEGGEGSLAVAYRPGEAGAYVIGSNLPAPPEGSVYELWMIQGEELVQGPCVVPAADGRLLQFVDAELGTTDTMAVTVESETCPAAPTGDPVFTAELPTTA